MMTSQHEIDLTLAIQLQAQFEEELRVLREQQHNTTQDSASSSGHSQNKIVKKNERDKEEKLSVSLIDPVWEMIDPTPNIHDLFLTFDQQFFWGNLHTVVVKWSPRMTMCAGVCSYEGRGGMCSIRLSLPLLKLRPRKDLIETLLHEMIHAYLFVTQNNRDRDGHGPNFHEHMWRINKIAATKISVYHSFHDEVNLYKTHVWQCNGPCRSRPPYYGLLKRSMNRAPSPKDPWWAQHVATCGGTYIKTKEPDGYGDKKRKGKVSSDTEPGKRSKLGDIRNFVSVKEKKNLTVTNSKKFNNNTNTALNRSKSNGDVKRNSSQKVDTKDVSPIINNSKNDSHKNVSKKNINGLNATYSGGVNAVNVNNASNDNFHGFNKAGSTNNGSSKNSRGKGNKSGSGTSTGMRVGSGSSTFVVGGKSSTKSIEKETDVVPESNFMPFLGSGQSLGGTSASRGISRLLNLQNNNPQKARTISSSRSSKVPDTTKYDSCPLCGARVSKTSLDSHIQICFKDIDDEFMNDDPSLFETITSGSNNSIINGNKSTEGCSVLIDDEVTNIIPEISKDFKYDRSIITISGDDENDIKYPCPICNEMFNSSNINQHLDNHFS